MGYKGVFMNTHTGALGFHVDSRKNEKSFWGHKIG